MQNFGAIILSVEVETAGRDSILDQVHEHAARFHDLAGHSVHIDIAFVADQHALIGVNENNTLSHVVDHQAQHGAIVAPAAAPQAKRGRGRQQENAGGENSPVLLK